METAGSRRLIAVPRSEDGLRRAIGEAHRRYTRRINFREKWHVRTSHPLGSPTFVQRLEQAAGRLLRPRKPGRPSKLLKQPN